MSILMAEIDRKKTSKKREGFDTEKVIEDEWNTVHNQSKKNALEAKNQLTTACVTA